MNSSKTGKGGFLIDTMIWGYLFNSKKYPKEYSNIQRRLENLPSFARLSISVISWGEIAVGLPGSIQTQHLEFIRSEKPSTITLDHHIAEEYGKLRGNVSTKALKRKKGLNPKDSVDRFTWLEVGSLENDLWIAAQAISRNLTLVTNDNNKGMKRISEVAGKSLHIANWAVNSK
ncbi:MAG TPA: type II toxin-antitoxin system VapC family toxin [Sedimentisphaerales bacterium]|nr:type II toxin-antitoxin system VapC family toxin [Sedimentisphaerales bacterium]